MLCGDVGEDDEAVRSVFGWSYQALPSAIARLFRLLGLHPGRDFSAHAAAALANLPLPSALDALDTLAGAHLIEQPAAGRFRMHDLLHAYAIDRVKDEENAAEQQAALRRVLTWYLYAAEAAGQHMERFCFRPIPLEAIDPALAVPQFPGYPQAAEWYDTEWTNLVVATRSAADEGFDQIAWQLAAVFRFFYAQRADRLEAGLATEYAALDAARRLGNQYAEGEILDGLAIVYFQSGRLDESVACHRAALAIRRAIEDQIGLAITLVNYALVFHVQRRWTEAIELLTEGIALFETYRDRRRVAAELGNLGEIYLELGRHQEALGLICRAVVLHREFERSYASSTTCTTTAGSCAPWASRRTHCHTSRRLSS